MGDRTYKTFMIAIIVILVVMFMWISDINKNLINKIQILSGDISELEEKFQSIEDQTSENENRVSDIESRLNM